MQSHDHDYCQLVLPLHGFIDTEISGERATIGPKQCAIIHHKELHHFSAHENARFLVADLDTLPVNMERLDSHFVSITDAMQAFVHYVEKQLAENVPLAVEQQLNVMFFQLLANQKFIPRLDMRIRKAIDVMEESLHANLQLKQLAEIACLSVSQFKALFKHQTGKTTGQYLLSLRMEKAKALLTYSDDPVSIVAEKVGYTDLSAFSRRFSVYFKQSPRSFLAKR